MATLINLTPHAIVLSESGLTLDLDPRGPARVEVIEKPAGYIEVGGCDIEVYETSMSTDVTGLPAPEPGVFYIVSRPVAEAAHRPDLLVVHQTVRDAEGRVIGAKALARVAPNRSAALEALRYIV